MVLSDDMMSCTVEGVEISLHEFDTLIKKICSQINDLTTTLLYGLDMPKKLSMDPNFISLVSQIKKTCASINPKTN